MDQKRGILRKIDKESDVTKIKTPLHQLKSPLTNQQRRSAFLFIKHVSQNKTYSLSSRLIKARNALNPQNRPKTLRCFRLVHLLRPRNQSSRSQYHNPCKITWFQLYHLKGTHELRKVEKFLLEWFLAAQKGSQCVLS